MKAQPLEALPRHFKNLALDDFQAEAIWNLKRGASTLVSAPTGTGKTVIADYLVDACVKEGHRIVYTAPVKALVNQKYRSYVHQLGRARVGVLTGDVAENAGAPVVVMTTEVFRNMVIRDDGDLQGISWAVFDEIHYLDHVQRGTVWEEAILFMPASMRILGLSATVPNIDEIASWIESVHRRPVAVVIHRERAVPLEHLYYNRACGEFEPPRLKMRLAETVLSDRGFDSKGGMLELEDIGDLPRGLVYRETTSHLDLVFHAGRNGLFPCLYFVMSRQGCEEKAGELSVRADYLNPTEKEAVRVAIRQELSELGLKPEAIPRLNQLRDMWQRGIAFHHAGMLPAAKQIVETLLERRLLRVLYATETFAVGVNMPVRTVCFDSLKKYDGAELRYLTQGEYFQMAGRAGRRGFDRKGTAIAIGDFSSHHDLPPVWDEAALEPITSRMQLSFNMVANIAARFGDSEVEPLLKRSLAGYQARDEVRTQRLLGEFAEKKEMLRRLDYLDGDGLLPRGEICRHIYVQEILVTELLWGGVISEMDTESLCEFASSLVYEPRAGVGHAFRPPRWLGAVDIALTRANQRLGSLGLLRAVVNPSISPLVSAWVQKRPLMKIIRDYPVSPGDFVNTCRRAIDLLRQIGDAMQSNQGLTSKIRGAISALDRDVVSVRL